MGLKNQALKLRQKKIMPQNLGLKIKALKIRPHRLGLKIVTLAFMPNVFNPFESMTHPGIEIIIIIIMITY